MVFEREAVLDSSVLDWFMATVLFIEASARDPTAPSIFQVADMIQVLFDLFMVISLRR